MDVDAGSDGSMAANIFSFLLGGAAGAVTYSQQQVHDLNVCWNTVYRTVFNFNRWESVKCFINGLGKLSLRYICLLYTSPSPRD